MVLSSFFFSNGPMDKFGISKIDESMEYYKFLGSSTQNVAIKSNLDEIKKKQFMSETIELCMVAQHICHTLAFYLLTNRFHLRRKKEMYFN